MSATVYIGDNLQIITNNIQDNTIDFIYFNPPFGTTKQSWDNKLDWPRLFKEFFRVLKEDGVLAIHCSIPFNYTLIREAPKAPSYSWYWLKENISCHLNVNKQPLRNTEEILIWTNKKTRYYSQRIGEEERTFTTGSTKGYYDGSTKVTKTVKGRSQTHHITMKRNVDGFSTRPRELVELMLNSYTKPGDIILDPTCYKGMCGVISKELGRKYIGIDKYFYPEKLMY
jgi:site-specific DNA-methyltransferase (adenine-specific)